MKDYTNELLPYTSVDYYQGELKQNDVTINLKTLAEHQPITLNDNVTFIYILEGEATLLINGEGSLFKAGELVLLMSYHAYSLIKIKGKSCLYYECNVSMALLLLSKTSKQAYLSSVQELDKGFPLVSLTHHEQKEIISLFKKLEQEKIQVTTDYQDVLILYCTMGLIYLFLKGIKRREQQVKDRDVNDYWKILQYIHFHHQKDLTIDEVAQEFQLSEQEVVSLLKQLTGLSFAENINRVRIINSAGLLQYEGLSINQIGRIVGFKTDAHFYKEFKKANGCTPKMYRLKHYTSNGENFSDETKNILIYIYENYRQPLSLTNVSDALNLSTKKIREILAKELKMTCSELVNEFRVSLARGLISNTKMSLMTIAELVGFRDPKKFRAEFKKKYGMTPKKFRDLP